MQIRNVLVWYIFQIDRMPLVNYEGDSSDGEEEEETNQVQTAKDPQPTTARRLHLPVPSRPPSKPIIEDLDDDEYPTEPKVQPSSTLLADLPKPKNTSTNNRATTSEELPETELEDIVRGDNKDYARHIPQLPKAPKRKRDGPVKIFIPTIEQVSVVFQFILPTCHFPLQDSDEEDKPKRKQPAIKRVSHRP